MDIMLSLNLWFVFFLCMVFLFIGVMIGCRLAGSRHSGYSGRH